RNNGSRTGMLHQFHRLKSVMAFLSSACKFYHVNGIGLKAFERRRWKESTLGDSIQVCGLWATFIEKHEDSIIAVVRKGNYERATSI
ncbi:hypothetical protein Ancab_037215, partial [Ancistrocladus abbreviatus]